MEIEYEGVIRTDDMILLGVRQKGTGPYETQMTVPGMTYDQKTDKALVSIGSRTDDGESVTGIIPQLTGPLEGYDHVSIDQTVELASYHPATGHMVGPMYCSLDVETDLAASGNGDGYVALAREPAQMDTVLQALTKEGIIPDDVVTAYGTLMDDPTEGNYLKLLHQIEVNKDDIALARLHIEWYIDDGDITDLGFAPGDLS